MDYPYRLARSATLSGTANEVFTRLDDPARLGRHMTKPSAMMLGGRMYYVLGPEQGRQVAARIDIRGSFLGLRIWADQVVVVHDPPESKVWKTLPGERLLAIGPYQLGFTIRTVVENELELQVFIDYDLPSGLFGRFLGTLLGGLYARWCVASILKDASIG